MEYSVEAVRVDLDLREHKLRLFEFFLVSFARKLDFFLFLSDPLLNLFPLDIVRARRELLSLESLGEQSMVGLTLPLDDLLPHLKHVWVLVHIETCSKGVQVVTFEKVLEWLSLKQCLRLLMTTVMILQLLNVKIRIMSRHQSASGRGGI